jgi:hypothetical protein
MNFQSVLDLKKDVLDSLIKKSQRLLDRGLQSLVNPNVESRLAVGYSKRGKNNFWLELRVQRGGKKAFKEALDIKKRAKGDANIEIIPEIEIPYKIDTLDSKSLKKLRKATRPLHIGLSIGHENAGAGTLGAFIETNAGVAILSNSHVLALMGRANIGDPIFQPGKPDVDTLLLGNVIATLKNAIVLAKANRHKGDAAIALLLPNVQHESNRIPRGIRCPGQGQKIKFLNDPNLLSKDKLVCKIGRTTGYTRGKISAIALDNVPVKTGLLGNLVFDNVIEISHIPGKKPFSKSGDSGSLVFTEREKSAIGLHFAGGIKKSRAKNVKISYCCSLSPILDKFNATFLED